jgi:hypothetical protein
MENNIQFLGVAFENWDHLSYGLFTVITYLIMLLLYILIKNIKLLNIIIHSLTKGIIVFHLVVFVTAIHSTNWGITKTELYTPTCIWFNLSMLILYVVVFFLQILKKDLNLF